MFITTRTVRARYSLQANTTLPKALDALYATMLRVCEARGSDGPVLVEGSVYGMQGQTVRFRGEDGIMQIQGNLPTCSGTLIMRMVFEDGCKVDVHMMGEVRKTLGRLGIELLTLKTAMQEEPEKPEEARQDARDKQPESDMPPQPDWQEEARPMPPARGSALSKALLCALFAILLGFTWIYFQRQAVHEPVYIEAGRPKVLSFVNKQIMQSPYYTYMSDILRKNWETRVDWEIMDSEENTGAMGEYDVRFVPTQIILDAEGVEVARIEGPVGLEEMQRLFVQAEQYR